MEWLADELPARLAEAQVHQQSVNQIRAQFYAETVQYWYDKLQRLGDKRITRWIPYQSRKYVPEVQTD